MTGHDVVCRRCTISFFICSRCFRGQVYCSSFCRKAAYKERKRLARKKNAATPHARALHRIRNKNYRVYGRKSPNVMDPSSDKGLTPVTFAEVTTEYCVICKVRRANENLELFSIPPN